LIEQAYHDERENVEAEPVLLRGSVEENLMVVNNMNDYTGMENGDNDGSRTSNGLNWKKKSAEKERTDSPRSFEEMLDEEIKLFEMRSNEEDDEPDFEEREQRFIEEFRLFEEKEQRGHAGVSELFDEPVISE